MLFPVKTVFLEKTEIGVSLMIAFIVYTFESVWVQLSLLSFQPQRIRFCISLTAPYKVVVVLSLVRIIAFYIPRTLNSTRKGHMSLFPTIFTLQYTQVHVCPINSSDIASNIEAPIDEFFGFVTTLNVSDIQPDDSYIRLWRYFNNPRS